MSGVGEHIPVLPEEVAAAFAFIGDRPARLIDGTLGNGGHAAMLLRAHPGLELLGIDRDEDALARAADTLAFAGKRVHLARGVYSEMDSLAAGAGWEKVDGILLDIGVSSPQIDTAERGFSWRMDGPLDMRMDRRSPLTASRLLNRATEAELERIFREYGEFPKSRKLAAWIVARRDAHPFSVVADLVHACDEVMGRRRSGELPHPTLPFQALRIAVNDELGELERGLPAALSLLKEGGRLAVISFHSLEDRMVKQFFRHEAAACICPHGLPVCVCGKTATLREISRKAYVAGEKELAGNRRAAPAKLRVVEKIVQERE